MQNESTQVMSIKDWVITLFISFIPLVGFVMLFVWAFSAGENPNKANWAKATLIWMVVAILLFSLFWMSFLAAFLSNYQNGISV